MQHDIHPSNYGSKSSAQKAFHDSQDNTIIFHCYWYGTFGRMQALSVKSLLASQKNYRYEVWLWLDADSPDADTNDENNYYLNQVRDHVTIKSYTPELVKSFPAFKKVFYTFSADKKLAARSDDFRIWVLHEYGGCYFDLDVMFLRDMGCLFSGSEFVYAWEQQTYANSAVIFLRKGSYINEYIARKTASRQCAQPWVLFRYSDKHLYGMKLYECSLFDPLWIQNDDCEEYIFHDFDGFFQKNDAVSRGKVQSPAEMFPYSYCYHWHNRWQAEIEAASPFEFCEKFFDDVLKNSLR